jgi:GNAT superfamily N-acetyltransferase
VSELGALNYNHEVDGFDCGVDSLNEWLTKRAFQAQQSRSARTFVFSEGNKVVAYYSLSTGSLNYVDAGNRLTKGLGKHPVPVVLLSRLGVDLRFHGKELGRYMLQDALFRVLNAAEQLGIRAVQVHPVNEDAKRFYKKFGFREIGEPEYGLYLLLKDIRSDQ